MKKLSAITSIILVVLLCSSCQQLVQDRKEIDRITFIKVIGVDQSPINPKMARVTISSKKLTQGAGKTPATTPAGQAVTLVSDGSTIFEAIRSFDTFIDKQMFWGQTEYIIIGEAAARSGIEKYLDFFSRESQFRMNDMLLVTKGCTAEELIRAGNSKEHFIGDRLDALYDNINSLSLTSRKELRDFITAFDNPASAPLLPCIYLYDSAENINNEVATIALSGYGVFRHDKLAGFLMQKELARGTNWLTNQIRSGIIVVKDKSGGNISLEIVGAKTAITPTFSNGKLNINVTVDASSNIGEQQSEEDIYTTSYFQYLQGQQEKIIRAEVLKAIGFAQERDLDFIGINDIVYHKHPVVWEQIKDSWKEMFPGLEFEVKINSLINRTYAIKEPNGSKEGTQK